MNNMSNDETQAKESESTYYVWIHRPAVTVLPRLVSYVPYWDPL